MNHGRVYYIPHPSVNGKRREFAILQIRAAVMPFLWARICNTPNLRLGKRECASNPQLHSQ